MDCRVKCSRCKRSWLYSGSDPVGEIHRHVAEAHPDKSATLVPRELTVEREPAEAP